MARPRRHPLARTHRNQLVKERTPAAMSYAPDPGGVFASDAHRRVMAHLPNPDQDPVPVEDLITHRINQDPHTLQHFQDAGQVADVLHDLEADGHAKNLKDGWKNTPAGFDALTGPPADTARGPAQPIIGLDPGTLSANGEG
jgi:hypothetical protein